MRLWMRGEALAQRVAESRLVTLCLHCVTANFASMQGVCIIARILEWHRGGSAHCAHSQPNNVFI